MDKLKSIDWKKEGRQLVRDYIMVVLGSLLLALAFYNFHRVVLAKVCFRIFYVFT